MIGKNKPRLVIDEVSLAYDGRVVSEALNVKIPTGLHTAIVGPNGCGKSTLLRAMARIVKPKVGSVYLDGKTIHSMPSKEVARQLGLLPQHSVAPDGITVADLVARGRAPYQSIVHQWRTTDEEAVRRALEAARLSEQSRMRVDELSGGQRQRAWIAMLLAQETSIMLLDEPTTYLDIAHQYELMEMLLDFKEAGTTVVTVLHDLNQAARYADHLIIMKEGEVVATGDSHQVISAQIIKEVFGLEAVISPDPVTGTPMVIPRIRRQKRSKLGPIQGISIRAKTLR